MQLRVLVLGNKNVIRRVATSLTGSDIEVICSSQSNEAINLLKKGKI